MHWFQRLSLKQKLTVLMVFTSVVAVFLTSASWLTYEFFQFRQAIVRDVTTQAEIVGANCAAAVAFGDPVAAHETLFGLRVRPRFEHACLFNAAGELFAEYKTARTGPPPRPQTDGHRFAAGDLLVFRTIRLKDDRVGTIYLRANLDDEWHRLKTYALLAVLVMAVAVLVALLLSTRLQQFVTEPILDLAHAARSVTAENDYGLRVTKRTTDEIGRLTDDFNAMLAQIEKSNEAVHTSEERFRQLAENIHEVFWLTDPSKTDMIYISPGYEAIWGRSRESLYLAALEWLDAVHPDDRARVRSAVLTKQIAGTYDEEYRVVRPDGTVRWIRDRAFPVHDDTGKVYRIAGIAEDVTERKQLEQQLLEISEREQRRIGQDLHDGLCQHLTGTALAAKVLEQTLAAHRLPQAAKAAEIGVLINQGIALARALARGLTPVQLDAHGLVTALHELANSVEHNSGIPCPFICPQPVPVEDNVVATHLYRIAQEAINNAVRHANASQITITLTARDGAGQLRVSDDGVGLPVSGSNNGLGLHIMANRARVIGATLDVQSGPQSGTSIICSFNLTNQPPKGTTT